MQAKGRKTLKFPFGCGSEEASFRLGSNLGIGCSQGLVFPKRLRPRKHVDDIDFVFMTSKELDISNTDALRNVFSEYGPFDYCINCAAYTNVDGAENNKEEAFAINAEAVKQIVAFSFIIFAYTFAASPSFRPLNPDSE